MKQGFYTILESPHEKHPGPRVRDVDYQAEYQGPVSSHAFILFCLDNEDAFWIKAVQALLIDWRLVGRYPCTETTPVGIPSCTRV